MTVGTWLDKLENCERETLSDAAKARCESENEIKKDRNEREIQSAISLARRHSNVNAIMVGNEGLLRGDQTARGTHRDHPARQAYEFLSR